MSHTSMMDAFSVQCYGKVPYTNRAEAGKASQRIKIATKPYRCPHCDKWHLSTHKQKKLTRRRQLL